MNDTRVRFVSEVDLERDLGVRKPLKVEQDNQRRFIRLDISSPVDVGRIKDVFGVFHPDAEAYSLHGEILNISAGGVLVEMEAPVNEGDLVALRFSLNEVEPLEGVLGLVKRCEPEDGVNLVGIQFVNRDNLSDMLTQGELEVLSAKFAHFDKCVHDLLSRYLYRRQA